MGSASQADFGAPKELEVMEAVLNVDFKSGKLSGPQVTHTVRRLGDLKGIFLNQEAFQEKSETEIIYQVQYFQPVGEGQEGGLFWGNTLIEPGQVGDEYYMTKGHFHAKRDRGEYYIGVAGEGALILMDDSGKTWFENMKPGSVHYIPGRTAHRVANVGSIQLAFLACWPSDAGHDYETIAQSGFSARLLNQGGKPVLVGKALDS